MPKAINDLIKGCKEFKLHYFDNHHPLFETLSQGQKPKALVISCSDSRVDPVIVTKCEPGDLFVIRNVANLVPPYEQDNGYHGTSAALEFGIGTLGIQHIIVFGHTQCEGIHHLLTEQDCQIKKRSFISQWMNLANWAHMHTKQNRKNLSHQQQVSLCGQYSLIHSLNNLMTFPWIKEKVENNQLTLHAWQFNIATGDVAAFTPKTFPVAEENVDVFKILN
ncbi:MAG: carbonic anhydrase [Alphaproteobacteria bacterium]